MQPRWASTTTRSPTWNSSTVGPSAATVPAYSWPGVKVPGGGWEGKKEPARILRSVPHREAASTRSRTSPGPGLGTGFSTTPITSGPKITAARMVDGITVGPRLVPSGVTGHHAQALDGRVDRAAVDHPTQAGRPGGQEPQLPHLADGEGDPVALEALVHGE